MRLAQPVIAIATLVVAANAFAQPSPTPRPAVEPLIQCKVAADAGNRVLRVDIAWPSGLKPRFPRDEGGVIFDRAVALLGPPRTSFGRIEDNPEWAAACEHGGCQITYSVDYGKGIATDKRGERGFEDKQGIVMAPLVRWVVRPEDRRARGRLRIAFDGSKGLELVTGVMDARPNHVETDLVVMDGPHAVLGEFTHKTIDLAGGRIDVALGKGERGVRDSLAAEHLFHRPLFF